MEILTNDDYVRALARLSELKDEMEALKEDMFYYMLDNLDDLLA